MVAIDELGQANQVWLQTFLQLPSRVLSMTQWAECGHGGLLSNLRPVLFTGSTRPLRWPGVGTLVSMDGNGVHPALDACQGQSPLHRTSA